MNTLNFNDADLKANREGCLSDAQMKRLDAEADQVQQKSKYTLQVSIAVFAVVAIVIGVYVIGEQNQVASRMGGIFLAIAAMIFIAIFMLTVFDYGLDMRRLANTPIHTTEGAAEFLDLYSNSTGVCTYRLILRRRWYSWFTFDFDDENSRHFFEPGSRYRVYYLSYHGRQILSAEEIEPEKAKHTEL